MMITIQLSNELPQPQPQQQQQMAFVPTTDTINNNNDECTYQDRPCEKYRQFMDSSRQERTLMIEKFVETFANVIDSIWHPKFFTEQQAVKVMPTRGFINEILKRSKATYSTLQISLFYIFRVKKAVHYRLYQRSKNTNMPTMSTLDELMCCGRRMFLASLMLASKYLHDKNYQNKAWSQITGLDIKEINAAEMAFLTLIDYRLYVSKPTFDKWYTQLHGHIQRSCKVQLTQSEQSEKIPCTIPSPPPEMQQQLAPLSPPSEKGPNCITYQRSDSGVSFMSPPQQDEEFTSKKRQWNDQNSEESDFFCSTKRFCQ